MTNWQAAGAAVVVNAVMALLCFGIARVIGQPVSHVVGWWAFLWIGGEVMRREVAR